MNITPAGFFAKLSANETPMNTVSESSSSTDRTNSFENVLSKSIENNTQVKGTEKDTRKKSNDANENSNNANVVENSKKDKKVEKNVNIPVSPSGISRLNGKLTAGSQVQRHSAIKENENTGAIGEAGVFAADFMNILNNIIKNLDKLSVNSSGERTDDFSDIARASGKKLKDIFDKLKNSLSAEDVKKALTEIEKLTADPNFKKLMNSLSQGDENSFITPEKFKNLSQMVEKFKNLLSGMDDANIGTAGEILKALQKGELETGFKDIRHVQGRHRVVEQDSRHRENSDNHSENNMNHQAPQKNEQAPRIIQNMDNSQNIHATENNVKFNQLVETNPGSNTQNVNYREPISVPRDMLNQVVKNARIAASGTKKEISFQIEPKEFGKIKLNLSIDNEHVTARIAVESEKVHKFLNDNRSDLIKQLQNAGLTVDNVDIQMQDNRQNAENRERHLENLNSLNSGRNTTGNVQVSNEGGSETEITAYPNYPENTYMPEWLSSEVNLTI